MNDVLVTAAGCVRPIKPMNCRDYTITEMQGYVGGLVEFVDFGKRYLVVAEEGKKRGMPVNRKATELVNGIGIPDYICGNAMLVSKKHIK